MAAVAAQMAVVAIVLAVVDKAFVVAHTLLQAVHSLAAFVEAKVGLVEVVAYVFPSMSDAYLKGKKRLFDECYQWRRNEGCGVTLL